MTPQFDTPDAATWARLSPLLDEALDLAPLERAAWLDALRTHAPDDAAALQALLERHEAAGRDSFLTGSVHAGSAVAAAGHRLGPWTIEAPLGEGGMASVWLARRSDGRHDGQAAIKLMHGRLHGTQATQRFEREGHILARLTHPHIARLMDAGVTEGGQPYLVLELVQGERIDGYCNTQRLTIAARLALFDDVLAAVAHAHNHLVIHRDLKPGNVLVGADGCVKLLDFGIAKLLDDEAASGEATELTRDGGRALTPEYAAPEQLRGEAITTATDVYALGVMLYQLLGGHHPTVPATGATAAEVLQGTLQTVPPRLSQTVTLPDIPAATALASQRNTTPQRLQRDLAGDLDNIVARALRKDPRERYPTVAALADDLRRHRAHEPVAARPDSLAYRTRKFVRRHRGGVLVGGLTTLAILAGVLGTVTQAQRAIAQSQRAEIERQRALDDLDLANAMNNLMQVALGPMSDQPITVAEVLKRGERMANLQFSQSPRIHSYLLNQLAELWGHGAEWDRTEALLNSALASAEQSGDPVEVAITNCRLGLVLGQGGEFDKGIERIDAAIAKVQALRPDETAAVVACLTERSNVNENSDRLEAALADTDQALRLMGTPRTSQVSKQLVLRSQRASVLGSMGRIGPAAKEYESLLAEWQRRGELDNTGKTSELNSYAVLLISAGQTRRAQQTLDLASKGLQGPGSGREADPVILTNQARVLLDLGEIPKAVDVMESALAIAIKSGNERTIGFSARSAAETQCAAGNLPRCKQHLALSAKHLGAILPPTHPSMARLDLFRAELALAAGQPGPGKALALQAAATLDSDSSQDPWRIRARLLAARANLALNDTAAALVQAQLATATAQAMFSDFPDSHLGGLAHGMLGEVYAARGEAPLAQAAFTESLKQLEASLGPDAPTTQQARARLLAR